MSKNLLIYLLQNQDKLFLDKENKWADGREPSSLYKTRHRDEALNQLFEINSKEIHQRIRIIECEATKNGQPVIDPAIMPPPIPKDESKQEPTAKPEAENEIELMSANNEAVPANITDQKTAVEQPTEIERESLAAVE